MGTKSTSKKQRKTPKNAPPQGSTRPYPIHKIYNRRRAKSYKQIGPCPKITQKIQFNPMNRMLNVFKCPTIPFLLGCPKKTRGQLSTPFSPFYFYFFIHNRPILTCKCLFHWGKDPRNVKKWKKRCQTALVLSQWRRM